MKNRKNVLIVFVVLAILCLGIGYAALTDTLVINGTVGGSSQNAGNVEDESLFNLEYVTDNEPTVNLTKATGSTLTATASYANAETATITVSNMCVKNEKVIATFTIKNSSSEDYIAELSAVLSTVYDAESAQYLEVSYSFEGDGGILSAEHDEDQQTVVIKKDGTATITVEILMTESLIAQGNDPQVLSATITVTITGKHVDESTIGFLPYTWA